ncbi:hypothetical protein BP5796_04187 [Coleophoma crateriformis]|uniref:Uncharacterized protein n=1 Tax=Coleophoma crateriformis TaxID=565419 RepID=A0A3D8SHW2_9HELO|nr:hypothetical protein BP5796_04187 [Coleophoma crateriformis]
MPAAYRELLPGLLISHLSPGWTNISASPDQSGSPSAPRKRSREAFENDRDTVSARSRLLGCYRAGKKARLNEQLEVEVEVEVQAGEESMEGPEDPYSSYVDSSESDFSSDSDSGFDSGSESEGDGSRAFTPHKDAAASASAADLPEDLGMGGLDLDSEAETDEHEPESEAEDSEDDARDEDELVAPGFVRDLVSGNVRRRLAVDDFPRKLRWDKAEEKWARFCGGRSRVEKENVLGFAWREEWAGLTLGEWRRVLRVMKR